MTGAGSHARIATTDPLRAMVDPQLRAGARQMQQLTAQFTPMSDDRTGTSRALPPHLGAFGWNADNNRFGWRCFLGQEPRGDDPCGRLIAAGVATELVVMPGAFHGFDMLCKTAAVSRRFTAAPS
jgi:acetyl esterase/lipase